MWDSIFISHNTKEQKEQKEKQKDKEEKINKMRRRTKEVGGGNNYKSTQIKMGIIFIEHSSTQYKLHSPKSIQTYTIQGAKAQTFKHPNATHAA